PGGSRLDGRARIWVTARCAAVGGAATGGHVASTSAGAGRGRAAGGRASRAATTITIRAAKDTGAGTQAETDGDDAETHASRARRVCHALEKRMHELLRLLVRAVSCVSTRQRSCLAFRARIWRNSGRIRGILLGK